MKVTGFDQISLEGVKGVLLDIDNTLYPYDPCHKVAQVAAKSYIVAATGCTETAFDDAYSVARKRVHGDLPTQAAGHSRLLYGQKLVEQLTGKTDFELTLGFEKTYWDTFLPLMDLLPEARAFLEQCRIQAIPVCLVTDLTAQIQHQKAIRLGLAKLVQFMVTSEEAGIEKPGAYMFNLGIEKLGLASPEDVIMVGDSLKKDIAGAESLGIKGYHILIEP